MLLNLLPLDLITYRGALALRFIDSVTGAAVTDNLRVRAWAYDPAAPRTLVAEDGDRIVGFVTTRPSPEVPSIGELMALYVDPPAWRGGHGRALIAAARAHLAARASTSAALWLLAGNRRAEAFYLADGWRADGARRHAEVWGVTVDELRMIRALP